MGPTVYVNFNKNLGRLYSLCFIMLIAPSIALSQCPCSASKTITLPYSGAPKTLSYGTANDSLCITGTGTFSSNISMSYNNNTSGPTLIICSGASMTMTGTLSESGPKKPGFIYNYGSVVFNDPSCCAIPTVSTTGSLSANNVTIYNYGYFEVNQDYYQTNTATFTNYAGSTFKVGRNLTINDGTLTNSSTVTVGNKLSQNGSSVLTNNTNSTVTTDSLMLASTGAFSNSGTATAASYMSFTGSGPRTVNNGVFITEDLYVTRGIFTSTGCGGFIVSRTTTITNSPGLTWSGNFGIRDSTFNSGSDNDNCSGTCPVYAAPGSASLSSCGSLTTLPVTFGKFHASQLNSHQVKVSWVTESESNNSYFIIQRSKDASTFEDISKIKGSGIKTTESNYSFIDNFNDSGVLFYRIKQMDIDGNSTYSNILAVSCMGSAGLHFDIFPNPSTEHDEIHIDLAGIEENSEVLVVLMDKLGSTLFSKIYVTESNNLLVGIGKGIQLPKGIFYIQASSHEKIVTEKIIIE